MENGQDLLILNLLFLKTGLTMNYKKSITFISVGDNGVWCHDYTICYTTWFIEIEKRAIDNRVNIYEHLFIKGNKK